MPIAIKLFRSLIEIAAIGGQSSLLAGDDGCTSRAGEARDELYIDKYKGKRDKKADSLTSSGITWSNIL